jgi:hypothetical protein
MRLYVAAYSVPGIGNSSIDKHSLELEHIPEAVTPGIADIFIMVGAVGGMIFVYLMASRLIPIMNFWEQKELLLYKVHRPFHRTEVMVLGKPE